VPVPFSSNPTGLLDLAEWGRLWTGEQWAAELMQKDDAAFAERLRSQSGRGVRWAATASSARTRSPSAAGSDRCLAAAPKEAENNPVTVPSLATAPATATRALAA